MQHRLDSYSESLDLLHKIVEPIIIDGGVDGGGSSTSTTSDATGICSVMVPLSKRHMVLGALFLSLIMILSLPNRVKAILPLVPIYYCPAPG